VPTGSGDAIPTPVANSNQLPFTGVGDMVGPILLALIVVLGGVVAWRWAQLREAVAKAASQVRHAPVDDAKLPTGYDAALRRVKLEKAARRVFNPRVA